MSLKVDIRSILFPTNAAFQSVEREKQEDKNMKLSSDSNILALPRSNQDKRKVFCLKFQFVINMRECLLAFSLERQEANIR